MLIGSSTNSRVASRANHAGEGTKPSFYCLDFFPYPSGAGLTVGHCRNYIPTDVISRYYRMGGYDVLHPMGWDAFGLPAENEAIQQGTHPAESTARYAANYKRQLKLIGCSYDWDREISSSDPRYYRWTQWFFLLLYGRGLAYRAEAPVNWCPHCQTGLANEEVQEGACWRCNTPVIRRTLMQWWFRITAYADELAAGLEELDWPDSIKTMQRHWIANLHDWLISRQRYWGVPIPIVICPACGVVPVPEVQLPVRLPQLPIGAFEPRGDGRSPLSNIPEFVNTTCPRCVGPARRETDTMSGFACSSWYFLRFASPHHDEFAFDVASVRRWLPVDLYAGGSEHATAHLLYARFWTKVMADAGLIDFREPFPALRSQGVVHAADGRRMSKSRPETVVTPDEVVARHGADALRAHILFVAPFEANITWDETAIVGVVRWLRRIEDLVASEPGAATSIIHGAGASFSDARPGPDDSLRRSLHRTICQVSGDIEAFKFNTAVASLMGFVNELQAAQGRVAPELWNECCGALVRLLAPMVPTVAEQLWQQLGGSGSVHDQAWPSWDEAQLRPATVTVIIQVDGRTRARVPVQADIGEEAMKSLALSIPRVRQIIRDKPVRRVIIVPGRLVNIVLS